MPLKTEVAQIGADKADRWGNLAYIKSARNFNPAMAMTAEMAWRAAQGPARRVFDDPAAILMSAWLRF